MPSILLCFHLDIPQKLSPYSFFDIGKHQTYRDQQSLDSTFGDSFKTALISSNNLFLELLNSFDRQLKLSFYLPGATIELLEEFSPEALMGFVDLAKTKKVEFLLGPYSQSLHFINNREEFGRQLDLHQKIIKKYFGQQARVICNTALIYNNYLAYYSKLRQYKGIIISGLDRNLKGISPSRLYYPSDLNDLNLLPTDSDLSYELNVRLPDLTTGGIDNYVEDFIFRLSQKSSDAQFSLLYLDYKSIVNSVNNSHYLFRSLIKKILTNSYFDFKTISEAIKVYKANDIFDAWDFISEEGDLYPWQSNPMQREAFNKISELQDAVLQSKDKSLYKDWMYLLKAEHFYYMDTHGGKVHDNPYKSPYNAYVYFINALSDLKLRLGNF